MPGRILIVEPNPETARDMFQLFHGGPEDYELRVAESVADALEKVQTEVFDCVIMDANLPEMVAYEAVPLMRTIGSSPAAIVIAERNSLELETKIREQDVYYYHLISFDQDELRLAVRNLFETLAEAKRSRTMAGRKMQPILLKQLRSLCQKTEQGAAITPGPELNED